MISLSLKVSNLTTTTARFADAPRKVRLVVREWAAEITREGAESIRVLTPVRTGRLQRSIRAYTDQAGSDIALMRISTSVPYAPYVEMGTKAHTIYPRKAGGVLVFQIGGRTVFARRVNHPGTQGAHMFKLGLAELKARLPERRRQLAVRVKAALSK